MGMTELNKGGIVRRLLRPLRVSAGWLMAVGLVAAMLGIGSATGQQAPTANLWYTQQQADIGRREFNTSCAACHGYSMFTRFLKFRTADRFYDKISGSMPRWAPASLPEQDYVNILAYMLQETGFAPGNVPLTSERARLRQIVLPSPGQ